MIEIRHKISGETLARIDAATLRGADLSEADLSWAGLSGANLSWADLSGADLRRADLSGADLRWANLSWANMRWATLGEANLSRADLRRANLSGADLRWANLSGADLRQTVLDPANVPNADCADFTALEGAEGYVVGYRTRKTSAAGRVLVDDRYYAAEVFSTADTECHPGWYLWPTREAALRWINSDGREIIVVHARRKDIHRAGSKWRSRMIYVPEQVAGEEEVR